MPLVSIIVVGYNGKHLLQACFKSLSEAKEQNWELILVDNASTDGTREWFVEYHATDPRCKAIWNTENLGFAQANNQGIAIAQAPITLFLNSDTTVTSDFLGAPLAAFAANAQLGACQGKVLVLEEPTKIGSVGDYLTGTGFLSHIGFYEVDHGKYETTRPIFSAIGAAFFIRTELCKQIGSMVGDFFAYFEESDLAWRVWLAGFTVKYIPGSTIYHAGAASFSKKSFAWRSFLSYRNRIRSIIRNCGSEHLAIILPTHILVCLIASIVFFLTGKASVAAGVMKALWWNLTHLGQILKERKDVQTKIRKVLDNTFWSQIYQRRGLGYYWKLFLMTVWPSRYFKEGTY